jgi:hypothetical protein
MRGSSPGNNTVEIIFDGESYKVEADEKGFKSLIRYNTKYQTWIHLTFSSGSTKENLQSIFDVLQKQYIDEFISNYK